jgi:hypothetical protein
MSIIRTASLSCILQFAVPSQEDPGYLEPINIIVHGEYLNNLRQTFLSQIALPCVLVSVVAHHETPEMAIGLREVREAVGEKSKVRLQLVCFQVKAKIGSEKQKEPAPVTESVLDIESEFAERLRSVWARCLRDTRQPTRLGAYLDGSYYLHCVYNTGTYWASAEASSPSKGSISHRLGSIVDALVDLVLSPSSDDARTAIVKIDQSLAELVAMMDRLDAARESKVRSEPQPDKK